MKQTNKQTVFSHFPGLALTDEQLEIVPEMNGLEWLCPLTTCDTHTYQCELQLIHLYLNNNSFLYSDTAISFASGHSYLSDYLAAQQPKPSVLN